MRTRGGRVRTSDALLPRSGAAKLGAPPGLRAPQQTNLVAAFFHARPLHYPEFSHSSPSTATHAFPLLPRASPSPKSSCRSPWKVLTGRAHPPARRAPFRCPSRTALRPWSSRAATARCPSSSPRPPAPCPAGPWAAPSCWPSPCCPASTGRPRTTTGAAAGATASCLGTDKREQGVGLGRAPLLSPSCPSLTLSRLSPTLLSLAQLEGGRPGPHGRRPGVRQAVRQGGGRPRRRVGGL